MRVDFSTELNTLEGKPLMERAGPASVAAALIEAGVAQVLLDRALAVLRPFFGTGDEPKEVKLTACRACANALQAADASISGAERVDRMRLAIKLMDNQPVEVSKSEEATILKCVEKAYDSPLIYFRVQALFKESVPA